MRKSPRRHCRRQLSSQGGNFYCTPALSQAQGKTSCRLSRVIIRAERPYELGTPNSPILFIFALYYSHFKDEAAKAQRCYIICGNRPKERRGLVRQTGFTLGCVSEVAVALGTLLSSAAIPRFLRVSQEWWLLLSPHRWWTCL